MRHLIKFSIIISSILFLVLTINTDAFSVDTCVDCHKDKKFRVQNKKLFDYYTNWKDSIHDVAGVSCHNCHGGNPDQAQKEKAHAKHLSPADESSMVFYKNIPGTCGKCHEKVYGNFIESKHYKNLIKTGRGPACVTCHGSVVTNVYYTSIVLSACKSCHNRQTKNHPEIIDMAEQILHRLNVSKGYLKWTSKHFTAINKLTELNRVNALYQNIADSWHQFNFANTDKDSRELLSELRAIFNKTFKKEKK